MGLPHRYFFANEMHKKDQMRFVVTV